MTKIYKTPEILTWVFFISEGVDDNADLMRVMNLCIFICGNDTLGVDEILISSAYLGCIHDIPPHLITREKIQEMIDFK